MTNNLLRGISLSKYNVDLIIFLISNKLNDLTDKCKILYAPETDHSAIILHIKSVELKQGKGPGFWKFNQSRVQDETYVSKLRTELESFNQKYIDEEDQSFYGIVHRRQLLKKKRKR